MRYVNGEDEEWSKQCKDDDYKCIAGVIMSIRKSEISQWMVIFCNADDSCISSILTAPNPFHFELARCSEPESLKKQSIVECYNSVLDDWGYLPDKNIFDVKK